MNKRETLRCLRLGNLRVLFRNRWGPILPPDDAGRGDLEEMLKTISLGANADLKMGHAIDIWAPWMPEAEAAALIDQVNQMPTYQRRVCGKTLGKRLRVTNAERERLRLWTILPCDMTEEQLAVQRKKKAVARRAKYRKQTRGEYLSNSISQKKPWLAEGISRASWYRKRETSADAVLARHGLMGLSSYWPSMLTY
jgi:hypothetical protein